MRIQAGDLQEVAGEPPPKSLQDRRTAIKVDHLVKRYGGLEAVADISFEVGSGEIFALLGPNGAGKTTTVEILEGYRRPDAGAVQVLGLDPIAEGALLKGRIGVMLQEGGLYPAITPREALRLFANFYPEPADPEELLALVGLVEAADRRYRRLSGGQKQRLALALALVPDPEVVFLDEPSTGLDPLARRSTWDIILDLKHRGVTVVLTTHYLEEAERLADRVAIIDRGRLIALESPAQLIGSDGSTVRLRASGAVDVNQLAELPSARAVQQAGAGSYVFETADAAALLVEITTLLQRDGLLATELSVGRGTLEDVFLDLTGREFEE
jgi:ABC-2 type transport system ATP-binding protein